MGTALQSAQYYDDSQTDEKGRSKSLLRFLPLLILLGTGAACWFAFQKTDYFAIAAALLVMLGALNGFRRGFLGMLVSTIAMGVAIYLAPQVGGRLEGIVSDKLATTGLLNSFAAATLAGLAIFVGFNLIMSLALRMVLGKRERKHGIGNIIGTAVGGLHVAAAIALFLTSYSMLEPTVQEAISIRQASAATEEVAVADSVDSEEGGESGIEVNADEVLAKIADSLKTSELRTWFEERNVFEQVPGLNKVGEIQQSLTKLSDGRAVKRLLKHPSMKTLRKEQPEMKAALQRLIRDKSVVAVFQSKDKFGAEALNTIVRSDAVLELVRQPNFLSTAHRILAPKEQEPTDGTTTRYTSVQSD